MARPTVRWSDAKQRWMAWVTFPDGSRRKVERVDKDDADTDLKNLLFERATAEGASPRRERLASFDQVINAWVAAGAPRPPTGKKNRHAKRKAENTPAARTPRHRRCGDPASTNAGGGPGRRGPDGPCRYRGDGLDEEK